MMYVVLSYTCFITDKWTYKSNVRTMLLLIGNSKEQMIVRVRNQGLGGGGGWGIFDELV